MTSKHLMLIGSHDAWIHGVTFDEHDNTLTHSSKTPAVMHSLWLLRHPDHPDLVYSTGYALGDIVLLRVIDDKGTVEVVDSATTRGISPLSLDFLPDRSGLVVVNFRSADAILFPIDPSGRFLSKSPLPGHTYDFKKHYEPRRHWRQVTPHPHQLYRYGNGWLIPDLGCDKIWRLRWEGSAEKGKWVFEGSIAGFRPGDGARWIAVHPKGTHLYCIGEMSNDMTIHTMANGGECVGRQTILAPHDQGWVYERVQDAGEMVLLPPTRQGGPLLMVCGNRWSPQPEGDALALFAVSPTDPTDVKRTKTGWITGVGKHLRAIVPDASGKFLAVTGRNDNSVTVFKRVGEDGLELERMAGIQGVELGMCLVWMS